MRSLIRPVSLVVLAALSGCTLIMQGTTQSVTFTSEPAGATVSVAGQTGTTPVTLELPKDDYQVAFKRPGYEDHSVELHRRISAWFIGSIAMGLVASTIDFATGAWKEFESTDINVTLQPLPDTVQELPVSVSSQPPGADILIQNRSYGSTPKELKLPWQPSEKEKEVTLRLAGYVDKSVALFRSEKQLGATLEPKPVAVTLTLSSKPDKAEVRIDGRLLPGKTPITTDLTWKQGDKPRTAEWTLDGYMPEKREVTRDTKDLHVDFREAVEEIVLPLKIEPAGAKVVVDGKPLPEGAKQVTLAWSLSTTRHVLVLSQPGYASRTVEVVRAAAGGPLTVRLAPALPGNQ
jgi:hypothetical protein